MSITIDTLAQKIRNFRQQEAQFAEAAQQAAGAAKAMEVLMTELIQAERKKNAESDVIIAQQSYDEGSGAVTDDLVGECVPEKAE